MRTFTRQPGRAAITTMWLGLLALPMGNAAFAQGDISVQIQTKFVEITEDDAEELGFDWLLEPIATSRTDSLVSGGSISGSGGGRVTSSDGSNSSTGQIVDSSYDFQIDAGTTTGDITTMAPGAIGITGVFTDPQFQVVLRALHQQAGVDLMSAPTVLTRAGQRARIEIVREFIYPVEYDPPEIPQDLTGFKFFNPGETQFNIGIGGALGNLSDITSSTTTVRGVNRVERTLTQRVQAGQGQGGRSQNLNQLQRNLNRVQQQITQAATLGQLSQLQRQQNRLFRQINRQVQNNQQNTPVFQNRESTVVENVPFEEEIRQRQVEGIMDEDSPKLALGFTHFLDNHLGIGGQFEVIQGNLGNGYLGQAEVTWREPMDFERFGLAPYVTGGIGGIGGDGISEFVGSIAGGVEFRLQNDVGIFTEYSHNFLGNGMDFGQILAGINVVIGEKGIPKKPPPGGRGGRGGSFPVTPATPTAVEKRNVGVTLEVDPNVGADGHTIDLNLAPEVVEFEGFINYGSPITTDAVDAAGNHVPVTLTESRIEMPIFKTRKAATQVTILDGQTAVIGGLVKEDVQVTEDKIPILGDIPLIGRLFRTRSEKHFKRNLTIFVKAELIEPAGERE